MSTPDVDSAAPMDFEPAGFNSVDSGSEDTRKASPSTLPIPAVPEPIDPEACKAAGNTYFKQKNYTKAIEEYSKAISADPRNATYLANRAAAFMSAGKYQNALEDCINSDRLQPGVEKTLLRQSRILTSMGRPDEALEILSKGEFSDADRATARQMSSHIRSAQSSLESGNGSMT